MTQPGVSGLESVCIIGGWSTAGAYSSILLVKICFNPVSCWAYPTVCQCYSVAASITYQWYSALYTRDFKNTSEFGKCFNFRFDLWILPVPKTLQYWNLTALMSNSLWKTDVNFRGLHRISLNRQVKNCKWQTQINIC